MSELHKFIFEGLPVRGAIVRLSDSWQEVLRRRAGNSQTGPYPLPVQSLLGEMSAAAVLLQSSIQFDGDVVLQIAGDGPVKVAVAEVGAQLQFRSTATLQGEVAANAPLSQLVNATGQGRCAITLDPDRKDQGQQSYQGVVPLNDADGSALPELSDMLAHYMQQSEQLPTTLVLAADDKVAAGLFIQRLPLEGEGNLIGQGVTLSDEELGEHYRRIDLLTRSLKREELLELDVRTILRRLYWEEDLRLFEAQDNDPVPHFACSCSLERVQRMVQGMGRGEAEAILSERPDIEVGCEFCGAQYRLDPIDVAQLFMAPAQRHGQGEGRH